MDKFMDAAGVDKVYGNPVEKDRTVVIPAAEVVTSLGFGMGGSSKGEGGGGGGGYSVSRPVAVVIVTENGVRVEPVVDVTKVALAMFTAVGFMLSVLAKMKKGA
ncbi:MAG: sporulation protein [Anaerolineales bacterium]|nr:sporulation protein [Anaerolineales bacterium]